MILELEWKAMSVSRSEMAVPTGRWERNIALRAGSCHANPHIDRWPWAWGTSWCDLDCIPVLYIVVLRSPSFLLSRRLPVTEFYDLRSAA